MRYILLLAFFLAACGPMGEEDTPTPTAIPAVVPLEDVDGDEYTVKEGDCDDFNIYVRPRHPELCDNLDNDCDGDVDEDVKDVLWLEDRDNDEWGRTGQDAPTLYNCRNQSANWAMRGGDCDDQDPEVYPGAPESFDGKDSDCNGMD